LALTPEAVYRFYCARASQELLLRELKHADQLAAIPTRRFWANATYLERVVWAYDVVLAFQRPCLPHDVQHWNIATVRRELWWVPTEWIKCGNRHPLRLPAKYPHHELLCRLQRAAARVTPVR